MLERAAYIIPGFSHKTKERPYRLIAERFAARDITPVPIDIPWRTKGMHGYVRYARQQILERPASESYFCGFSLGAMCLLNAAPEVQPRGQILCSLMPLYHEDQQHQTWWMRAWVWRVYLGRRKVRYPDANGQPWPRTIFVYGEREHRIIQQTVRAARDEWFPNSETVIVPGARHAIADTAYTDVVLRLIDHI